MNWKTRGAARAGVALALAGVALGANAGRKLDPSELAVPEMVTCIDFPEPLVFEHPGGLLHDTTYVRFERGPWVAEHEDANGTYFRAPQGGVAVSRDDDFDSPSDDVRTEDGGLWIPNDPTAPPHYYTYFSMQPVVPVVPQRGADCSSVGYAQDPETHGVNIVGLAAQTGVGAAIGAAASPAVRTMGLGRAAGVGLAGGLIGGVIVAIMINHDTGKIVYQQLPRDPDLIAKIRSVANMRFEVSEVPAPPTRPASATASASASDAASAPAAAVAPAAASAPVAASVQAAAAASTPL